MFCNRKYTPTPKSPEYPPEIRQQAIRMYLDGLNPRRIGRHLGLHHRTVSLWVQAYAASLPDPPVPEEVEEAEMDELFTFIGEKNRIYILTVVDRRTDSFLGWQVAWARTQQAIQDLLEVAPKDRWYSSDAFDAYDRLWYHYGRYAVSVGKSDTYSVEAGNAELRHYLARLARSFRCFFSCPKALTCGLRIFVDCFNRRQLDKQRFPAYPAPVEDFMCPLVLPLPGLTTCY